MEKKIKKFVFQVTDVCDKRCEACCNRREKQFIKKLEFAGFQVKISQIAQYLAKDADGSIIIFTGGEPFFYSSSGGKYNIKSLICETLRHMPNAIVKIRTSGWQVNKILDRLVDSIFQQVDKNHFEILLGFNMFQKNGKDGYERLGHMIDLLSKHQDSIVLNTIYSKLNIKRNCEVIECVLAERGFSYNGFSNRILSHPKESVGFRSRHKDNSSKVILLGASPAYNALDQSEDNNYYEEITQTGVCRQLKYGVDHLYYDLDLSFYHCNDPFVDFSVPPVVADETRSFDKEVAYFVDRMNKLGEKFTNSNLQFKNKQERCAYCTRCMLNEED